MSQTPHLKRQLSPVDNLFAQLNQALHVVAGGNHQASRDNPAKALQADELDNNERKHSAALMRVNHVGEVCAQALYQSQAMTSRSPAIKAAMSHAAAEEIDHLAWCEQRLVELNSHRSLLNPLWYGSSFAIGTCAGLLGDKWNLGFVAATEQQVVDHLDGHLKNISPNDTRSRAIISQMREDEAQHANEAEQAGAAKLPRPVQFMMSKAAKVMTSTAYWV